MTPDQIIAWCDALFHVFGVIACFVMLALFVLAVLTNTDDD